MRSFIEYESEILPLSYIPYVFKCRLILLASVNDAAKLNIAFRDPIPQRHRPHECHNGVYITDSRYIVHYATKHAWFWSLWPCAPWLWFQYDLDGPYTIYPIWQSALNVDEVTNKDELLYINDTLVLFLTSDESYDLIVPKITGPYSRLVLHGYNYTWSQVKRLIHNKVKQVRIMDCIDVEPEEYDDVIDFVLNFCRGFVNKFAVHNDCFPPELMAKLNEAFKQHETHSQISPYFNSHGLTCFNHKRYRLFYCIGCVVFCAAMIGFAVFGQQPSAFRSLVFNEESILFCLFIVFITFFLMLSLPFVQLVFMIVSLFKFNPADVDIVDVLNEIDED